MADIHILAGDGRQLWRVAFHFPVPDVNNAVGVNYQEATINSGIGGTSQMEAGAGAGQILQAELDLIEGPVGELFEHSKDFPVESGATTPGELLAAVQAMYEQEQEQMTAALQKRLRYFGWTGSAT